MALNFSGIPDTPDITLPGIPMPLIPSHYPPPTLGFAETDDIVETAQNYMALDTKEMELPKELQRDTKLIVEVPHVELVRKDDSRNAKNIAIYTVFVVKGNNNWELKYPIQKFVEFDNFISLYSAGQIVPRLSSSISIPVVSTSMFKKSSPEDTPEVCEGRRLPLETWLRTVLDLMNVEDYYIVDDFLQYTENCLAYAYKQNDIELVLKTLNKWSKLYSGYTYQVKQAPSLSATRNTPTGMLSPVPFASASIETELGDLLGLIQDCNNKGNAIISQLYVEQGKEQQMMASLTEQLDDMQKQCVNAQNSIDQQVQQIRNEIEVLCSRIEGINNDIDKYIKNQTSLKSTSLSYSLTSRYYKLLYEQIHTTLSVYRDVKDHTFPRGRKGSHIGDENGEEKEEKPAIEYKEGVFLGSEMFIEEIHLLLYQKMVDKIVKQFQGADVITHPDVPLSQATEVYTNFIENPPTFESIPPLLQTITQDLLKDNASIRMDLNSMGVRHPLSLYNYFTRDLKKNTETFETSSTSSKLRPTLSQAMKNPELYKKSDMPMYGLKTVSNQYDEPTPAADAHHKSTNPFDMDGEEEEEEVEVSAPTTPSMLSFLNKPDPVVVEERDEGSFTPRSTNPFDMDDEEEEEEVEDVHYGNPFDTFTSAPAPTPVQTSSTNPFDMEPETTTETQSSGMNSLFDDLVPLSSSSPKPVVKPSEVKASPARPNTNTVMSLFNNAQKNNKPAAGTPGNSNSAVPSVFNNLFKKNFNTPTNASQASKPNFSVCCS